MTVTPRRLTPPNQVIPFEMKGNYQDVLALISSDATHDRDANERTTTPGASICNTSEGRVTLNPMSWSDDS